MPSTTTSPVMRQCRMPSVRQWSTWSREVAAMSASSAVTMNTNMPKDRMDTRSAWASLDISMNT